jgi:hypothetical protein
MMETKFAGFAVIAATLEKLRRLYNEQKRDFEDCLALDDYQMKWYKEKVDNLEKENADLRARLHAVLMAASGLSKNIQY